MNHRTLQIDQAGRAPVLAVRRLQVLLVPSRAGDASNRIWRLSKKSIELTFISKSAGWPLLPNSSLSCIINHREDPYISSIFLNNIQVWLRPEYNQIHVMLSEDSSVHKWKPAIRITILLLICSVASLVRIFSVIRYESIIHEFDPWFNFRATKFLVNTDFKEFWNFFDSESWYPLGRNVGATVYPGLMVTL